MTKNITIRFVLKVALQRINTSFLLMQLWNSSSYMHSTVLVDEITQFEKINKIHNLKRNRLSDLFPKWTKQRKTLPL